MIIVDLNSSQLHSAASWAYSSASALVEEERAEERRTKDRGDEYTAPSLSTVLFCAASCSEDAEKDSTPEGKRHSLKRALGWLTVALALHDAAEMAEAEAK